MSGVAGGFRDALPLMPAAAQRAMFGKVGRTDGIGLGKDGPLSFANGLGTASSYLYIYIYCKCTIHVS